MVYGDDNRVAGDDYFGPDVTILDDDLECGSDNVVEDELNVVEGSDDNVVREDGENIGDIW
ncbi:hypothetical protein Leryth_018909 [Lithospermum erythrorhizon]|nr:hypothetical protein Leryth_018909 [Lithospermum erythrorhizon]